MIGVVRERTDAIVVAMLPTDTQHPDALDALEAGADDFVVKPFSPRELVARLRAHLRHRLARERVPASRGSRRAARERIKPGRARGYGRRNRPVRAGIPRTRPASPASLPGARSA